MSKEYTALPDHKSKKYILTDQQNNIVKKIQSSWIENNKPVLLTGVSGSGKTLIYIDIMILSGFLTSN